MKDMKSPDEVLRLDDGGLELETEVLNPRFDLVPKELVDLYITNLYVFFFFFFLFLVFFECHIGSYVQISLQGWSSVVFIIPTFTRHVWTPMKTMIYVNFLHIFLQLNTDDTPMTNRYILQQLYIQ